MIRNSEMGNFRCSYTMIINRLEIYIRPFCVNPFAMVKKQLPLLYLVLILLVFRD